MYGRAEQEGVNWQGKSKTLEQSAIVSHLFSIFISVILICSALLQHPRFALPIDIFLLGSATPI
jgi:hypothetical protein